MSKKKRETFTWTDDRGFVRVGWILPSGERDYGRFGPPKTPAVPAHVRVDDLD